MDGFRIRRGHFWRTSVLVAAGVGVVIGVMMAVMHVAGIGGAPKERPR